MVKEPNILYQLTDYQNRTYSPYDLKLVNLINNPVKVSD